MIKISIFKSYDVRGLYPEELNAEIAYKLGRAFAYFLKCKNIVVARDCRKSSPMLFNAVVKGITDQGSNAVDIGLSTSPMAIFTVARYEYCAGVIITASHNPKQYNGIKFYRRAIPLGYEEGLNKLEILVNKKFKQKHKGTVIKKNVVNDYVKHLMKFYRKGKRSNIVIDASNGTAPVVLSKLLKKLNCNIKKINFKIDGSFPGHGPNPLEPENLKTLISLVKKTKSDLGVCFDGDADRVVFVDNLGKPVGGDFVIALLSEDILKSQRNKKIVYTINSSRIVSDIVLESKGKPILSKVGRTNVSQKMREHKAIFGGELSGHFFYKDNYYVDSGIITMLKMISLLSTQNRPLSDIIKPLKKYHQSGELNFEVEDKDKAIDTIKSLYKNYKQNFIDGLTVEADDFWFNLRKSNTEPLLRLNIEAKTNRSLQALKNRLAGQIKRL